MAEEFNSEIDSLKYSHESNTEWNLRREFLETHYDKFPHTRLVCLSNCFINVELYGCSYPGPLMAQLKALTDEIDGIGVYRQSVQERNQVKFVKSTESSGAANQQQWKNNKGIAGISFVKGSANSPLKPGPSKSTDNSYSERKPSPIKPSLGNINPLEQKSQSSSTPTKQEVSKKPETVETSSVSEKTSKFYQLGSQLRDILQHSRSNQDAITMVTTAIQKNRMASDVSFKENAGSFQCELFINNVFISSGAGQNKKIAKRSAFEVAFTALKKPYVSVIEINPSRLELETSDFPMSGEQTQSFTQTSPVHKNLHLLQGVTKLGSATKDNIHSLARMSGVGPRKRPSNTNLNRSLDSFIVVEPMKFTHSVNAVTILCQSETFNKVPVTYDFREVTDGMQTLLSIGGEVVASSQQGGKPGKLAAATSILEDLRQSNWTLIIKKRSDTDKDLSISKEEVLGEDKLNTAIPESNVGNKLLKMMGWTGGGIGKEGRKGIAEPVSVDGAINRSGLGLSSTQGISTDFKPKVKKVLNDYIKSDNQDDLVFSAGFLKEERAIIHQLCRSMGLRTRSYDEKGGLRYTVVSRKRDSVNLIHHLLQQGGQTSKYRLVPPGEYNAVRAELDGTP